MNIRTSIKTLLASATLVAAAGFIPAATASAAPIRYLISDGAQGSLELFINDPGIGNMVETTKTSAYYTLDTSGQAKYQGHTTFKMRVNGGSDCLQASSNSYIYDEGCNTNGTNQQFYHVDDYIYSVGLTQFSGTPTALQAVSNVSGSKIVGVINPTNNPLDQWTFGAIGP